MVAHSGEICSRPRQHQWLFLDPSEIRVTGQTSTLKSQDWCINTENNKLHLLTWRKSLRRLEHIGALKGNFDEVLEAKHGLALDWEIPGRNSLTGPSHILGIFLWNPNQFPLVRSQEKDILFFSGRGRVKDTFWNMPRAFPITNASSPLEMTWPEP